MRSVQVRKTVAFFLLIAFLLSNGIAPIHYAYAQEISQLPLPGTRINLSSMFVPPLLKGVKIYPDNPFKLDFILDKGDVSASTEELKAESTRLIKYFLASITVPEKDLWVNLSPYEKDRIVPDAFGVTEMGRDILAQDYMLKQITASVMYPEGATGKEFWGRVYAEAQRRFGSTDVPVDTFNKVWLVPEKAVVYENNDSAYVVESRLKVLLDEDYLALEKGTAHSGMLGNTQETNKLGAQIMRDVVIPILEREVNEGKNFAQLRQVYHSLILAIWFKDKIKESVFGRAYVDQDKVAGVDIQDKAAKDKIWAKYVEAFEKGAYNYIKEDIDPVTQQAVPRKYFSGGAGLYKTRGILVKSHDRAQLPQGILDHAMIIKSSFELGSAILPPESDANKVVAEQEVNPVRPLIDQPELRGITEDYLRRRYTHWGLPENLAGSILNTLIANVDDLSKGKSDVYKNVVDFETDPQWRAAYEQYKYEFKYASAFDQIKEYVQDRPAGSVIVDLGAGNNVFGAVIAKNMPESTAIGVDIIDYDEKSGIPN